MTIKKCYVLTLNFLKEKAKYIPSDLLFIMRRENNS